MKEDATDKDEKWIQYKTRMVGYRSLRTGNVYPCGPGGYANHGYGGIKAFHQDLPADEYPFTAVYEDPDLSKPAWMGENK